MDRTYSLSSRILYRGKLFLDHISDSWSNYVRFRMSRDEANRIRKRVVSANGRTVVDRKLLQEIKEYCRAAFGSAAYWPWLALYTELRGEFKEGWIPDDYYRFELLSGMNPEKYMKFSEAKTIDYKLFNGLIIEPLIIRTNGLYYDKHGTFKTQPEVKKLLSSLNDEIIIKPDAGRSGKRIVFKNSKELSLEDLPSDTGLLFQKVVKQHPELNRLHPYSVNTFRVLTFVDQEGSVKIKFINLKFGRKRLRVDNIGSGGGWVQVRINGKIEPNAYGKIGLSIGKTHPDTGTRYSDLHFPYLNKVTEFCKQAHRRFPYTRIVGWDVFVDENEEPKLIEWNANNPGFWDIEALFGPFFSELINW